MQGFFGVYDGHGGRNAAEFAAENLHTNILEMLKDCKGDEGKKEAIRAGYLKTDQEFLKKVKCLQLVWLPCFSSILVSCFHCLLISLHLKINRKMYCHEHHYATCLAVHSCSSLNFRGVSFWYTFWN